MKKFICIMITLLMLCVSFTACQGDRKKPKDPTESTAQASAEPETSETDTESAEISDDSFSEESGGIGGVGYSYRKYNQAFYGISRELSDLVGDEAFEEWKAWGGYDEGNPDMDFEKLSEKLNVLSFIQYFNISKEDFTAADRQTEFHTFTDEQIDALYADDKELLAQLFMNPRAININGDIYTPKWLMEHSPAEMKAVGITKEMLQEKYTQWVEEFDWGGIEISQNIKEKLDAWDAPVQDSTASEIQGQ